MADLNKKKPNQRVKASSGGTFNRYILEYVPLVISADTHLGRRDLFSRLLDHQAIHEWSKPLGDPIAIDVNARLGGMIQTRHRRNTGIIAHEGLILKLIQNEQLLLHWDLAGDDSAADFLDFKLTDRAALTRLTLKIDLHYRWAVNLSAERKVWEEIVRLICKP